jgi:hypothetical protein
MKVLYYIYQICIALPILFVLTILTALVTIVGSILGGAHFWGYHPGKIWSRLICIMLLIPVEVKGKENLINVRLMFLCPITKEHLTFFSFMALLVVISNG